MKRESEITLGDETKGGGNTQTIWVQPQTSRGGGWPSPQAHRGRKQREGHVQGVREGWSRRARLPAPTAALGSQRRQEIGHSPLPAWPISHRLGMLAGCGEWDAEAVGESVNLRGGAAALVASQRVCAGSLSRTEHQSPASHPDGHALPAASPGSTPAPPLESCPRLLRDPALSAPPFPDALAAGGLWRASFAGPKVRRPRLPSPQHMPFSLSQIGRAYV